jgi:hypothetical protein
MEQELQPRISPCQDSLLGFCLLSTVRCPLLLAGNSDRCADGHALRPAGPIKFVKQGGSDPKLDPESEFIMAQFEDAQLTQLQTALLDARNQG